MDLAGTLRNSVTCAAVPFFWVVLSSFQTLCLSRSGLVLSARSASSHLSPCLLTLPSSSSCPSLPSTAAEAKSKRNSCKQSLLPDDFHFFGHPHFLRGKKGACSDVTDQNILKMIKAFGGHGLLTFTFVGRGAVPRMEHGLSQFAVQLG